MANTSKSRRYLRSRPTDGRLAAIITTSRLGMEDWDFCSYNVEHGSDLYGYSFIAADKRPGGCELVRLQLAIGAGDRNMYARSRIAFYPSTDKPTSHFQVNQLAEVSRPIVLRGVSIEVI